MGSSKKKRGKAQQSKHNFGRKTKPIQSNVLNNKYDFTQNQVLQCLQNQCNVEVDNIDYLLQGRSTIALSELPEWYYTDDNFDNLANSRLINSKEKGEDQLIGVQRDELDAIKIVDTFSLASSEAAGVQTNFDNSFTTTSSTINPLNELETQHARENSPSIQNSVDETSSLKKNSCNELESLGNEDATCSASLSQVEYDLPPLLSLPQENTIDSHDEMKSIFQSPALDSLLANETRKLETSCDSILQKLNTGSSNVAYNTPNRQASYVKTLQTALMEREKICKPIEEIGRSDVFAGNFESTSCISGVDLFHFSQLHTANSQRKNVVESPDKLTNISNTMKFNVSNDSFLTPITRQQIDSALTALHTDGLENQSYFNRRVSPRDTAFAIKKRLSKVVEVEKDCHEKILFHKSLSRIVGALAKKKSNVLAVEKPKPVQTKQKTSSVSMLQIISSDLATNAASAIADYITMKEKFNLVGKNKKKSTLKHRKMLKTLPHNVSSLKPISLRQVFGKYLLYQAKKWRLEKLCRDYKAFCFFKLPIYLTRARESNVQLQLRLAKHKMCWKEVYTDKGIVIFPDSYSTVDHTQLYKKEDCIKGIGSLTCARVKKVPAHYFKKQNRKRKACGTMESSILISTSPLSDDQKSSMQNLHGGVMVVQLSNAKRKNGNMIVKILSFCEWGSKAEEVMNIIVENHFELQTMQRGRYIRTIAHQLLIEVLRVQASNVVHDNMPVEVQKIMKDAPTQDISLVKISVHTVTDEPELEGMKDFNETIDDMLLLDKSLSKHKDTIDYKTKFLKLKEKHESPSFFSKKRKVNPNMNVRIESKTLDNLAGRSKAPAEKMFRCTITKTKSADGSKKLNCSLGTIGCLNKPSNPGSLIISSSPPKSTTDPTGLQRSETKNAEMKSCSINKTSVYLPTSTSATNSPLLQPINSESLLVSTASNSSSMLLPDAFDPATTLPSSLTTVTAASQSSSRFSTSLKAPVPNVTTSSPAIFTPTVFSDNTTATTSFVASSLASPSRPVSAISTATLTAFQPITTVLTSVVATTTQSGGCVAPAANAVKPLKELNTAKISFSTVSTSSMRIAVTATTPATNALESVKELKTAKTNVIKVPIGSIRSSNCLFKNTGSSVSLVNNDSSVSPAKESTSVSCATIPNGGFTSNQSVCSSHLQLKHSKPIATVAVSSASVAHSLQAKFQTFLAIPVKLLSGKKTGIELTKNAKIKSLAGNRKVANDVVGHLKTNVAKNNALVTKVLHQSIVKVKSSTLPKTNQAPPNAQPSVAISTPYDVAKSFAAVLAGKATVGKRCDAMLSPPLPASKSSALSTHSFSCQTDEDDDSLPSSPEQGPSSHQCSSISCLASEKLAIGAAEPSRPQKVDFDLTPWNTLVGSDGKYGAKLYRRNPKKLSSNGHGFVIHPTILSSSRTSIGSNIAKRYSKPGSAVLNPPFGRKITLAPKRNFAFTKTAVDYEISRDGRMLLQSVCADDNVLKLCSSGNMTAQDLFSVASSVCRDHWKETVVSGVKQSGANKLTALKMAFVEVVRRRSVSSVPNLSNHTKDNTKDISNTIEQPGDVKSKLSGGTSDLTLRGTPDCFVSSISSSTDVVKEVTITDSQTLYEDIAGKNDQHTKTEGCSKHQETVESSPNSIEEEDACRSSQSSLCSLESPDKTKQSNESPVKKNEDAGPSDENTLPEFSKEKRLQVEEIDVCSVDDLGKDSSFTTMEFVEIPERCKRGTGSSTSSEAVAERQQQRIVAEKRRRMRLRNGISALKGSFQFEKASYPLLSTESILKQALREIDYLKLERKSLDLLRAILMVINYKLQFQLEMMQSEDGDDDQKKLDIDNIRQQIKSDKSRMVQLEQQHEARSMKLLDLEDVDKVKLVKSRHNKPLLSFACANILDVSKYVTTSDTNDTSKA